MTTPLFGKYKNNHDNWIQNHYKNNFFTILDVEANGDCFFATIREAFKTMGITITVELLRNILSNTVTEEQFKTNKELYDALLGNLKELTDFALDKSNNVQQIEINPLFVFPEKNIAVDGIIWKNE